MRRLYITEGETEQNFVIRMRDFRFLKPGKCVVYNIQQKFLSDRDSIMGEIWQEIFCIIDTDVLDDAHLNHLRTNLSKLLAVGKVFLVLQDKNFEDELKFMHETNDLCKLYGISHSVKDLKAHLKKEQHRNITRIVYQRYACRAEWFKKYLLQFDKRIKIKKGAEL